MVVQRRRMLSRAERDAQEELEAIRDVRRNRFRILVCIDGSEECYEGLRFASDLGQLDECDIILVFVRPIDQGLRSGGLQIRVARENMLEWGLELPGVQYLKHGLETLIDPDVLESDWELVSSHAGAFNDPLGDNKIEYRSSAGRSIVLKLKTAPDPVSGILDQYELGPYNLMIVGEPSRWRGELRSFWNAGRVQKVAMMSPCSVLVARKESGSKGHLICTDGSEQSLDAVKKAAVFSQHSGAPITVCSIASYRDNRGIVQEELDFAAQALNDMGIDGVKTAIYVGNPVEEIVKAAADYSLVVVSDSGKSWFKRFFIGSIAFDIMGKAGISVLNVR